MIVRDNYGVIVQHAPSDPTYLDGGDASRSTGIMATFGSLQDLKILSVHCTAAGFVRHPHQERWNIPSDFSRDQLGPLLAGIWFCDNARLQKYAYKKSFRFPFLFLLAFAPNWDPCSPAFIWHWILCTKNRWLYWYAPLGYLWQLIELLFIVYVRPTSEQNQAICMFHVSGLGWLYRLLHRDWKKAMREYWGNWRDQIEIAEHVEKNFL